MKKIVSLLLAVALMALALAACGDSSSSGSTATSTPASSSQAEGSSATEPVDDGTVYEFNVSFAAPEFSTTGITASLDAIQEASNGRIKFTYYYSWSLTSVANVIDDLNNGVVDIAAVPINEHLNRFPYSNLVTYTPFLGLPNMLAAAEIYDELYDENEVFAQEYDAAGLVYWTNFPNPPYNIFTRENYEIRTPEDLNGLQLITSSSMMQQFITANGGAPVGAPVTEYATSLNTGAVDGVVNHANVLAAFGASDFIKGGTVFGESGTAMALMMMCFSKGAWEKLPADLQQLFTDEAENLRDTQGDWDYNANKANIEGWDNIITLTDDEMKVWQDAFAGDLAAYITELEGSGATEAQAMYDALQVKIAAY